jgi:hypothetical protein
MSDSTKKISKSARNRISSQRLLESRGIEYHTNNGGCGYIDFWPGTGKWKSREYNINGYGVFGLLEMIDSGQL